MTTLKPTPNLTDLPTLTKKKKLIYQPKKKKKKRFKEQ